MQLMCNITCPSTTYPDEAWPAFYCAVPLFCIIEDDLLYAAWIMWHLHKYDHVWYRCCELGVCVYNPGGVDMFE